MHRVLQAVARGWVIGICPRRKFVEMADGGGVVGGEERAGLCHPVEACERISERRDGDSP